MPRYSNTKKALAACITAICLTQLTSCGTTHLKNGVYENIDTAAIPDAVPKSEPKSPYGNPNTYKVGGHTYKVLKSSKSYSKTGVASWYGPQFQGQLTSTNESYNMYAMTAASPELPLPSYVRVTNLDNGRNVIVKVNDRGPFRGHRLIDVSYVAARKLGFAGAGTANVRVTAVNSSIARAQLINSRHVLTHKSHYIQVGAFSSPERAVKVKLQIKDITKNRNIYISKDLLNNRSIYRVKIGPINTLAENRKIYRLLSNSGYTVMVKS
jgi:rare lipoprotein A